MRWAGSGRPGSAGAGQVSRAGSVSPAGAGQMSPAGSGQVGRAGLGPMMSAGAGQISRKNGLIQVLARHERTISRLGRLIPGCFAPGAPGHPRIRRICRLILLQAPPRTEISRKKRLNPRSTRCRLPLPPTAILRHQAADRMPTPRRAFYPEGLRDLKPRRGGRDSEPGMETSTHQPNGRSANLCSAVPWGQFPDPAEGPRIGVREESR